MPLWSAETWRRFVPILRYRGESGVRPPHSKVMPNSNLSQTATSVFAAAGYFSNPGVFCVLAILTTVFTVSPGPALACAMRTFLVLCHWITPAFLVWLDARMQNSNGQGAARTTI